MIPKDTIAMIQDIKTKSVSLTAKEKSFIASVRSVAKDDRLLSDAQSKWLKDIHKRSKK